MMNPNQMPPPAPPPPVGPHGHQPPPAPASSGGGVIWRFLIGLFAGTAISAVTWIFGWKSIVMSGALAVLMVPLAKTVLGGAFLFIPRWRSVGAGILISMALGVMIFGGMAIHSAVDLWASKSSSTSSQTSSGAGSSSGSSGMCKYDTNLPVSNTTTQPADSTSQPTTSSP